SSSTVAPRPASSASTRFVITSTTLKRRGPAGSTGFGGTRLRSRTTIGLRPAFAEPSWAFSVGTICAPVPLVSVSSTQTFPIGISLGMLRQHLVHRPQGPGVLGPCPVGDPEVALGAEVLASPDDHPALREALQDRGLVAVAERDPGEVRLAVGRLEAALAE